MTIATSPPPTIPARPPRTMAVLYTAARVAAELHLHECAVYLRLGERAGERALLLVAGTETTFVVAVRELDVAGHHRQALTLVLHVLKCKGGRIPDTTGLALFGQQAHALPGRPDGGDGGESRHQLDWCQS